MCENIGQQIKSSMIYLENISMKEVHPLNPHPYILIGNGKGCKVKGGNLFLSYCFFVGRGEGLTTRQETVDPKFALE